jgi:hypothetical protein
MEPIKGINLPTWQTYGKYSNGNYGAHALQFFTDSGTFWFSYQTLVAFQKFGGKRYVRQNAWSTTTGKHLNAIDGGDKKTRVTEAAFNEAYQHEFA